VIVYGAQVCVYTGWRRPIECLKLQVILRKRATNYRALLREMTHKDKASYGSSPLCSQYPMVRSLPQHTGLQHTATHRNTLQHTSPLACVDSLMLGCGRSISNTLQHTATHYNTLQHTATQCSSPTGMSLRSQQLTLIYARTAGPRLEDEKLFLR